MFPTQTASGAVFGGFALHFGATSMSIHFYFCVSFNIPSVEFPTNHFLIFEIVLYENTPPLGDLK